jgi:hypothetical protein
MIRRYIRDLVSSAAAGWENFFFTPADPATYSLIRILAGAMLLYTHAVWTLRFDDFFGVSPWLPVSVVRQSPELGPYAWSHFYWIEAPWLLWTIHFVALAVMAMFTLGLFSRTTSILTFLFTVSYANRVAPALFGLDHINGLLALYLMFGPSGACYSLDRWIARRRLGRDLPAVQPSVGANLGIRLIQLHMCVIYLFAGLGKLKGDFWWDGTAMWYAAANLEYQSLDLTWLASWPLLTTLLTHVTVWWEAAYCVLVWPRLTRPIIILLAIPLHLGIALFLGMITFGLVMLIANLAFVSPGLVRAVVEWPLRRGKIAGERPAGPRSASRREPARSH